MAGFTEVVSKKIFHPGLGILMTEEVYNAQIEKDKKNEAADIEACYNQLPERISARVKGNPIASGEKKEKAKSFLSGKILTSKVKTNPRKPGTHGFNSFKILLDNPGIAYEKYIELGGRPNDLKWDLDHEWVELGNGKEESK